MNILKEITKNFQYEENIVNPDVRKLTSGPFRGILVNKNGFCYCGSNTKTMKLLTNRGYYGSTTKDKTWIKPWRLTALVWHDKSPALHLDNGERDNYLNLLAFIKIVEKYSDEYELLMDGVKTTYYPLSRSVIFNIVTGCLGKTYSGFKQNHPSIYRKIRWDFFEEIGNKIKLDFQKFKNELSEELKNNLKSEFPKVTEDKEEDEPEEELEVCLSDPELGGAPSLKPKVKEVQTQSVNTDSKENKVNEYEDIPGYDPSLPMEAQEASVLEEIELRGYRDHTPLPNIAKDHAEALDLVRGLGSDPHYKLHMQAYEEKRKKDRESIDELQKLFDRRAQLKKMLDEIEEEIKEKIKDKLQ